MELFPHIFREYDIRGTVGKDLTEDFAELLGRAYGELARETNHNEIAIGWDCRLSSEGLANRLAKGINSQGVDVTLLGMGPTSVVYWSLFKCGLNGGIQVTGSHNPADMNGFKICLGKSTLSGAEIQDLYKRAERLKDQDKFDFKPGTTSRREILNDYIQDLISICKPYMGPRKLKVVVDAGNGVGGMVGVPALKGLGIDVIELYTEPDGTFPNHHPDPTVLKNNLDLIKAVKENKADFGIGWDGDADRIGVVDEKGEIIFGDMLLAIYARDLLKKKPNATVIADVKCSARLFADVQKNGGTAVMWKTGHSLVKAKLKELKADLAGEMSGHIFFGDRFYGFDCALNCSCRLVEIMSNTKEQLSEILADLPEAVSTPEIRLDCTEETKFRIVEEAIVSFKEYSTTNIDGVRINFDKGWGLVRASNTQPVLVMRFEAENQSLLDEYQDIVKKVLKEIQAAIN